MDRIYYHFPSRVDFEQEYGFNADMRFFVKAMAGLYGRSGSVEIDTLGPDVRRNVDNVRAKRDVVVDIVERRVDFLPLNQQNLAKVLSSLSDAKIADFKIAVRYSYFDKNFNKMSLADDVFLVRAKLNGSMMLQIVNSEGQGRTSPEEVACTIEEQLKHFKG